MVKYIAKGIMFSSLVILLGSLLGCGFKLQQNRNLSPALQCLQLQTPNPYGILTRTLQQNLKASAVKLVDNPEQANAILSILQDTTSQTLLSVSSTQQTRQYNLRLVVTFQVSDQFGRIIIPAQTLAEERVITIQSNQVLSGSNIANSYYQQMRHAIAASLLNRLASKQITELLNQRAKLATKHCPIIVNKGGRS